jgi:ADP-ribosylglycohydrolase
MPLTLPDRLAGLVLGHALGDAHGRVVEARLPDEAAAYARDWLGPDDPPVRLHPDFGQYSDDTQLTRELLLSLQDGEGWDPGAFGRRIGALFAAGLDVGAGPGTRSAALRLHAGVPWTAAATPAPYAGNGTAMRVAPIGLLYGAEPTTMCRIAAEQSRVTHADPRCAAAAVAVAGAVALAVTEATIHRRTFLERLARWVAHEDGGVAAVVEGIDGWADLEPRDAARHLHALALDPLAPREWQGISACAPPSVAWALYAFLRTPGDYWATVRTAIAVGGDTDTMAAMAGAVAGARLGPGPWPAAMLARLTDRGRYGADNLEALARTSARYAVS